MNIEKVKGIYRETGISTTPIMELKIKMIQHCLTLIAEGKCAINEKNLVKRNEVLTRCQELLLECINLLNFDEKITKNIFVVYEYAIQQVILANIKGDIMILNGIELVLKELLDAWKSALSVSRKKHFKGKSNIKI